MAKHHQEIDEDDEYDDEPRPAKKKKKKPIVDEDGGEEDGGDVEKKTPRKKSKKKPFPVAGVAIGVAVLLVVAVGLFLVLGGSKNKVANKAKPQRPLPYELMVYSPKHSSQLKVIDMVEMKKNGDNHQNLMKDLNINNMVKTGVNIESTDLICLWSGGSAQMECYATVRFRDASEIVKALEKGSYVAVSGMGKMTHIKEINKRITSAMIPIDSKTSIFVFVSEHGEMDRKQLKAFSESDFSKFVLKKGIKENLDLVSGYPYISIDVDPSEGNSGLPSHVAKGVFQSNNELEEYSIMKFSTRNFANAYFQFNFKGKAAFGSETAEYGLMTPDDDRILGFKKISK